MIPVFESCIATSGGSLHGLASLSLPIHDPVLIVAIAMAAFLILPLITSRLRLPEIIGVLVAGMLVGQHGIGLLERDETIKLLGKVGLLYLVFLAGLEVDLGDLSRKRRRAVSFGVLTFLVPQVLGTIGGVLFFDFDWPKAILLGSVFSSHSFLALLIAKRLGLTEREMTIAVIGGTVITDTLALLVLAGVAQAATAETGFGPGFLGMLLLQAGLFTAAVVFGVPILGRWFFRHVHDGGAHFAFMMTVLFTCGFVAHLVGLEDIIGAFLAGLAMNRLVPHHGVLANRAFFIGNTVFVPFFLLSVGMLIDLGMVVGNVRTIEMALFMTLTVILCKGGAAWLMRKFFGYSREDVVVAWGLSLPQAATTLAVVLVGRDIGLFDDVIVNATIVMVLVTCILGPMLVQFAGRRLAAASAAQVDDAEDNGDEGFQRILIPLANPQSSHDLLDLAIALRRPLNDEPLLPLSVAGHEQQVAQSERLLGASVLYLAAAEVPVTPVIRVDPNPVNGILRAASESRTTCMIVGWTGPESHWQRHFHLNPGIIDEVLAETAGQLFVVRLTRPLAVIEQLIVILPPLIHAEAGFNELIADCKRLTKGIGASMTLLTQEPLSGALQKTIAAVGVSCPLHIEAVGEGLQERLDASVDGKSLLCIAGCREGTISWNGAWHRWTTSVAHRHASVSIAVIYPRIGQRPVRAQLAERTAGADILQRATIRLTQPATGIEQLIEAGLPATVSATDVLRQRLAASLSALNASVVLVHAAADGLRRPQLTVLVLDEAIAHDDLQIHILLVLVNPYGVPAHRHLQHLATIARSIARPEQLQALLAAKDEATARLVLLGDG